MSLSEEYILEDFNDGCNFDYGEDTNSEPESELENQYYNSKLAKQVDIIKALECFQKVLDLEEEKGEWGFKSLKQIIKILFKNKRYSEFIEKFKELLSYMKLVTKNKGEKAINSILTYISSSENGEFINSVYKITLDNLKELNDNRLWFKVNVKLGRLYAEEGDVEKLAKLIQELYTAFESANRVNNEEGQNGLQLLDIYSLEIQLYSGQPNSFSKLKRVYEKALRIKSILAHPLTLGQIKECGGKIYLISRQYEECLNYFYEAFRNYDECGSTRKTICIKYLLLAAMLTRSDVNLLDSQECKQYRDSPQVRTISALYVAYQNSDIKEFEENLHSKDSSIFDDVYVTDKLDELRQNIRVKKLLNFMSPFQNIPLPFISNLLKFDEEQTENFLITCILNGTIEGKIDNINQMLVCF